MDNAIFSIKPLFAERILSLEKKVEFRKVRCKKDIRKMYIYATFPVQKVIGEAYISRILELSPEELWEQTQSFSGISKEAFDMYFKDRSIAYGYCLSSVKRYPVPLSLSDFGINTPPQSFYYVSEQRSDPNLTPTNAQRNACI